VAHPVLLVDETKLGNRLSVMMVSLLTGSGAVRLWVRNNLLCALAMIGCAVLLVGNVWSEAAFRLAFIAVMLTNCLVDIALARRFYFPEPDIRYKAIR
jgi:O-antigen/teichoic acid export membrane protein